MLFGALAIYVDGLETGNWIGMMGMPFVGIAFFVLTGLATILGMLSSKKQWFYLLAGIDLIFGILAFAITVMADRGLL